MTELSIVLPVHDEEALLEDSVRGILRGLAGVSFELLVCENGSRDRTAEIATRLARAHPEVRVLHMEDANYGAAIRAGIEAARGAHVAIVNADLWDAEFLRDAHRLLASAEVVIASKRHPRSRDERNMLRRAITALFTRLLNTAFGYEGTDTHGMKALDVGAARAALRECVSSNELLDSEVVIRVQRAGGRVVEVPLRVCELRPSRQSVLARAPHTVRDLVRLGFALRQR
jgi:glycosyltransferase AglD